MKTDQVEELPFSNWDFKVINVNLTSGRFFHLKVSQVEQFIKDKQEILIFDKGSGDMMHFIPFDVYHDNGKLQTFVFTAEKEHVIDEWKATLLKRFHWTWFDVLQGFINTNKFRELNRKLNVDERRKRIIHPAKEDVYNAFSTNFNDIRVVIIGQSPYPNMINETEHVANGWAFSTKDKRTPKTLQKIKEVLLMEQQELPNTLKDWILQGVLLLNSSLTLADGQHEGYYKDWEPFMKAVIQSLNTRRGMAYILMGTKAKALAKYIGTDNCVVTCEHPVAASYDDRTWNHEDVFEKVNQFQMSEMKKPIQWLNFVEQ